MKATFQGDGNVLHLDLGKDYMDVYTCKFYQDVHLRFVYQYFPVPRIRF